MIALIKITVLAMNLNSGSLVKKNPPQAVKKSDGKVAIPKKNIPAAAKIGEEITAEIAKAP